MFYASQGPCHWLLPLWTAPKPTREVSDDIIWWHNTDPSALSLVKLAGCSHQWNQSLCIADTLALSVGKVKGSGGSTALGTCLKEPREQFAMWVPPTPRGGSRRSPEGNLFSSSSGKSHHSGIQIHEQEFSSSQVLLHKFLSADPPHVGVKGLHPCTLWICEGLVMCWLERTQRSFIQGEPEIAFVSLPYWALKICIPLGRSALRVRWAAGSNPIPLIAFSFTTPVSLQMINNLMLPVLGSQWGIFCVAWELSTYIDMDVY